MRLAPINRQPPPRQRFANDPSSPRVPLPLPQGPILSPQGPILSPQGPILSPPPPSVVAAPGLMQVRPHPSLVTESEPDPKPPPPKKRPLFRWLTLWLLVNGRVSLPPLPFPTCGA